MKTRHSEKSVYKEVVKVSGKSCEKPIIVLKLRNFHTYEKNRYFTENHMVSYTFRVTNNFSN